MMKNKKYKISLDDQKSKLDQTKNLIKNLEIENEDFLKKKKQNLSTLSTIKNDLVSLKDSEKKLNKLIYDYDIDQKQG